MEHDTTATICEQVIELAHLVTSAFSAVVDAGRSPAVGDHLTDESARFVATKAVAGDHVPMNRASVKALAHALAELRLVAAADADAVRLAV